jgi:hypothetical protein
MNNASSKFQKKVLELVNGTNFSDAFVFDKLSELLNDNEQIAIKELKDPSNFHELLNGSISSLKIENKDFFRAIPNLSGIIQHPRCRRKHL